MKFSEKWLREWVNPPIKTNVLVEKLTQAGLEVDAIEPVAGDFSGVMVGQVVSVAPHPDADKLRLCQVDVARPELLSIVCGASNVRPMLKVPVAVVGAVLPGNFKIKPAKLRGVSSFGMLCSAKELGLAESADGLLELAIDAPVGTDFRDYLDLDDVSIDVDLTPNRSDCLGIAGIAREVGVLTDCDVTMPHYDTVIEHSQRYMNVAIVDKAACPRYVGRVIENIQAKAHTPVWMQEKLRRSGLRSLGPVVDVTNFVMLELGQPMHAFDLDKLNGTISVRKSNQNESITLLDGQTITIAEDTLLIADNSKPLALAGVMGGQDSKVDDATQHLFLEAAFFNPLAIAGRARSYGLHTDSSHRFERGVDPDLPRKAIDRATSLLLSIVGGKAGPITEESSEPDLPKAKTITLRSERIKRVLGIDIEPQHVEQHLTRLGLSIVAIDQGWQVTAPSFRFDLAIEVDLIEELGRLFGYDRLPKTRPIATVLSADISEHTIAMQRMQELLIDRGYQEAITYSFVDPAIQQHFILQPQQSISLANPISADLSVMRTSLWAGLIQAMVYNLNRQHERIRLFEVGRVFTQDDEKIQQHRHIAGAICGTRYSEQWSEKQRSVDFFDIKADVEALLALGLGNTDNITFIAERHCALHPGQSARIYKNGLPIGWIGALDPRLNKSLDVKPRVYLFELTLSALMKAQVPTFEPVSRFPALRRDLALLVDGTITAGEIESCLKEVGSDILKQIQLFDVYSGDGVEQGMKSIAVAFHIQHAERTLTDQEVESLMQTITQRLQQKVGATIRS